MRPARPEAGIIGDLTALADAADAKTAGHQDGRKTRLAAGIQAYMDTGMTRAQASRQLGLTAAEGKRILPATAAEAKTPVSEKRAPIRTKPVRVTLDLTPAMYADLTRWANTAANDAELPRITLAKALRAMIRATLLDKGISAVVTDLVRRDSED